MARFIVKIRDRYLDWSTVADAPVTHGMQLEEFRAYYEAEYGADAMAEFEKVIRRVDDRSASTEYNWLDNRAGPEETCLTEEELYRVYCRGEELDRATVEAKLRTSPVDVLSDIERLAPDASEEELKRTFDRIPLNATLKQIEQVLGAGENVGRKRGPWLEYRWSFPTHRIICQFDKRTGELCGRELNANFDER